MDDRGEYLDAGCEPGLARAVEVADEDAPYLALFADVDWSDTYALDVAARKWRTLFHGSARVLRVEP